MLLNSFPAVQLEQTVVLVPCYTSSLGASLVQAGLVR